MKKYVIKKIKEDSSNYGVPFWKLPDFLISVMAVINISGMFFTYYFSLGFVDDPRTAVIFVAIEAAVVLIIGYVIAESSRKVIDNYRLKEEFIDLVSHQIRSPITSLRWNLELLSKEKQTKKQATYINRLNGSVKNISSLVNDFVYLSRLEQSRKEIKMQKVDLEKIIKDILEEVNVITFSKNIEVDFENKNKDCRAWTDEKRIKIVITNLIENAFKYSFDKGKVEIKLYVENKRLVLAVKDKGFGIDKKSKAFIFDKFYRSEIAKKFVADGTGVGLYISKELLTEMKGQVWFESEKNQGSTFYIGLPMINPE